MLIKYILNFWIWWYFYKAKKLLASCAYTLSHTLGLLNVIPMAANLFVPMFQDKTITGRLLSLLMRVIWVLVGSAIQIIITIPVMAVFLIWIFLPLLPIIQIIRVFANV